nr:uncharacterized protein LOC119181625 [Rhipicephalus microplus]
MAANERCTVEGARDDTPPALDACPNASQEPDVGASPQETTPLHAPPESCTVQQGPHQTPSVFYAYASASQIPGLGASPQYVVPVYAPAESCTVQEARNETPPVFQAYPNASGNPNLGASPQNALCIPAPMNGNAQIHPNAFMCGLCQEVFWSLPTYYARHSCSWRPKSMFKCLRCGWYFNKLENLNIHEEQYCRHLLFVPAPQPITRFPSPYPPAPRPITRFPSPYPPWN